MIQVGQIASPLQYLEKVSQALKVAVYVKREDLYQKNGLGGSKIRKLQNILPLAQQKNATDIVTAGSTGSHHIYAVVMTAKALDLPVHAVLLRQPPLPYAENIFTFVKNEKPNLYFASNHTTLVLRLFFLYRELKRRGRIPYLILPGASNAAGITAYAEAGLELHDDIGKLGQNIDFQICAYGTGGITAGLQAAAQVRPSLPPLLAVQLYPGWWNGQYYIKRLAALAWPKLFSERYRQRGLVISKEYLGDGYGTHNWACEEAVSLFAKDGIYLDPIYMARAGQALVNLTRSKTLQGVVLWYTAPGLIQ